MSDKIISDAKEGEERERIEATDDPDYKILGEFNNESGAGVLGINTAASGTPIGVEGAVPNAGSGYGLSTPDDARIEGTAELGGISGGVTGNGEVTDLAGSGLELSNSTLSVAVGSGLGTSDSGDVEVGTGQIGADKLDTNFADLATLFGDPVTAGATVDLGGNDVQNAGTASASAVDTDALSDNGSGAVTASSTLEVTGEKFGVDAETQSTENDAAGVQGSTTDDNHGVIGRAYDDESNLPTVASFQSAGVYGVSDKSDGRGVVAVSTNDDGLYSRCDDSSSVALLGLNTTSDGFAANLLGDVQVDGDSFLLGQLNLDGNDINNVGTLNAETKYFIETVDTPDGTREVRYTSLEGPTPRTEVSGVATIENGSVEVALPEHFGWVTDGDEEIIVQVTPHTTDDVDPGVTERSTDRIVIEDPDTPGTYEVSYTVKGTRDGYADQTVVSEPPVEDNSARPPTREDIDNQSN